MAVGGGETHCTAVYSVTAVIGEQIRMKTRDTPPFLAVKGHGVENDPLNPISGFEGCVFIPTCHFDVMIIGEFLNPRMFVPRGAGDGRPRDDDKKRSGIWRKRLETPTPGA